MPINKGKHKRILPPRLKFPTDMKFTTSGDKYLLYKNKKVQIVASKTVLPTDYPTTDLLIDAIGVYSFKLTEVDYFIFSIYNQTSDVTDAVIVPVSELVERLTDSHFSEDKIHLKLFLCSKGLMEYHDAGTEFLWMGIWLDKSRNFSRYYNNWSILQATSF